MVTLDQVQSCWLPVSAQEWRWDLGQTQDKQLGMFHCLIRVAQSHLDVREAYPKFVCQPQYVIEDLLQTLHLLLGRCSLGGHVLQPEWGARDKSRFLNIRCAHSVGLKGEDGHLQAHTRQMPDGPSHMVFGPFPRRGNRVSGGREVSCPRSGHHADQGAPSISPKTLCFTRFSFSLPSHRIAPTFAGSICGLKQF